MSKVAGLLLSAVVALLCTAATAAPNMPGEPVPAKFQIGGKDGSPLDHLPPNMRVISAFGERPVISPNGKKIAFIGQTLGDAFEYDIATGETRNLTSHMPHKGWMRIHYLKDGSYILAGPRNPGATPLETRMSDIELFWMDAGAKRPAVPLNQFVFEGIASSREANRIAWAALSPRKGPVTNLFTDRSTALNVGDIVVVNGVGKLVNIRTIKAPPSIGCLFEAQDFLPGDVGVTVPCYGPKSTKVLSIALADGQITTYPTPPDLYGEIEGMFPDGKRSLVECGNDSKSGNDLCLLELTPNNPRYTRLTHALDYGIYKFADPTVSPDGRLIAFQAGFGDDAPGVGRGLLLMELPAGF